MFWEVTTKLVEGFGETLKIFGFTLLFALPLGLVVSMGSMSKIPPIRWLTKAIVWIVRGTPLMLQLIIIFYGPGLVGAWASEVGSTNPIILWLADWKVIDRFFAVLLGFVINYSCYFSEIYRGGIESVPKGQYEAGQVLGMTKTQVFFKVVFLQVVKRVLPPIGNEIITLVKDTSLARIIAVQEVIFFGQAFIKSDGIIWPLFYTGAFYLVFSGLLTVLFGKIEKKLSYFKTL